MRWSRPLTKQELIKELDRDLELPSDIKNDGGRESNSTTDSSASDEGDFCG